MFMADTKRAGIRSGAASGPSPPKDHQFGRRADRGHQRAGQTGSAGAASSSAAVPQKSGPYAGAAAPRGAATSEGRGEPEQDVVPPPGRVKSIKERFGGSQSRVTPPAAPAHFVPPGRRGSTGGAVGGSSRGQGYSEERPRVSVQKEDVSPAVLSSIVQPTSYVRSSHSPPRPKSGGSSRAQLEPPPQPMSLKFQPVKLGPKSDFATTDDAVLAKQLLKSTVGGQEQEVVPGLVAPASPDRPRIEMNQERLGQLLRSGNDCGASAGPAGLFAASSGSESQSNPSASGVNSAKTSVLPSPAMAESPAEMLHGSVRIPSSSLQGSILSSVHESTNRSAQPTPQSVNGALSSQLVLHESSNPSVPSSPRPGDVDANANSNPSSSVVDSRDASSRPSSPVDSQKSTLKRRSMVVDVTEDVFAGLVAEDTGDLMHQSLQEQLAKKPRTAEPSPKVATTIEEPRRSVADLKAAFGQELRKQNRSKSSKEQSPVESSPSVSSSSSSKVSDLVG